jgi:hypothetical protein
VTQNDLVILASLIAASAGLIGALIGVLGSGLIGWRQEIGRRRHEAESGKSERVRAWRLDALRQTRLHIEGQLAWLEAFTILRDRSATWPDDKGATRVNVHLVGDVAVIREYEDLVRDLLARIPMRWREAPRWLVPRTLAQVDPDDLARVTLVRAHLLSALDAHELRVLRDEPMRELMDAEIGSLQGAEALLGMLRDRIAKR